MFYLMDILAKTNFLEEDNLADTVMGLDSILHCGGKQG
jgi:hypothetical protein